MKTKKLKKDIILFHGSKSGWTRGPGSFRGPGWFTTKLETALFYSDWGEGKKPGVLVYKVKKPVVLYQLPLDLYLEEGPLPWLLMEYSDFLTFDELEVLQSLFEMDWTMHKWDLKKIEQYGEKGNVQRAQFRKDYPNIHPALFNPTEWFDDQAPEWTLLEKLKRHRIDGVKSAIEAICKTHSNFHGWTINHGGSWEVMLCRPNEFLERTDLWEVTQEQEEELGPTRPHIYRDSPHTPGVKAITPSQRVGRRYLSAMRVARRYLAAERKIR